MIARMMAALLFLVGCGTDGSTALAPRTEDAGIARDGGMTWDAGTVVDAGSLDAGASVHAGTAHDGGIILDAGAAADGGVSIAQRCFPGLGAQGGGPTPDYDQFQPVIGSHCFGTNHQNIEGVQRVVFLGDSVTVGTPPTSAAEVYRARLADRLAARFGLQPPDIFWKSANVFTGEATWRESGDFASCAKWGARTDDLMRDNHQVLDCFPMNKRHLKTLVLLTLGGNDLFSLTKDGAHAPYEQSRAQVQGFVGLLRDAVRWMKDPANVPGGAFVVFGNMYEYTDATGDIASCAGATLSGLDRWDRPRDLARLVVWANEQFMSVAVETRADMILMLEHFCGHGFRRDDPRSPCYRGPGAAPWFDLTCIHPNPAGHAAIANMMMSVVGE